MKVSSVIFAVILMASTVWPTRETIGSDIGSDASEMPLDCTFTVKGTFEGVAVNVTITVSNVSLIECIAMKAAAKAAIK